MFIYGQKILFLMNSEVVVIRGDMIKSREIKEKAEFWKKLDHTIERVNKNFKKNLLSKFEIFKGDEITGICHNLKEGYIIISEIIECLHPLKIRIVISEGTIDYNRKTEVLNELDGEVFWNASKAMNELKKSKRYIRIITKHNQNDEILTSFADILAELKYDWTEKEREIIEFYDIFINQNKVARKLHISQQSVSDGLRRAKYNQIRNAEKTLIDFI